VASYLTIKYLLRFLQHHTFYPFGIYRLILAGVILAAVYFFPGH
jgi:undecaprenyl pyrophosphate phosphatase UppP